MDVEQRARELLAAAYEADGMGGRAGEIRNPAQYMEKPDRRALGCIIAALTPPEGHVVVTRNQAGQAVAVTRQDDEGRILSVIAEFEPPVDYVLVPVGPTEKMQRAGAEIICSDVDEAWEVWRAMIDARPEVPDGRG